MHIKILFIFSLIDFLIVNLEIILYINQNLKIFKMLKFEKDCPFLLLLMNKECFNLN